MQRTRVVLLYLYIDSPFSSNDGTHLTFGLVLGALVFILNPGFVTSVGSQSPNMCFPGPVFLTLVGYDITPQREKSPHCAHLSLLILLNDAPVPRTHNQMFSHMSEAALGLFVDCFVQFADAKCLPQ